MNSFFLRACVAFLLVLCSPSSQAEQWPTPYYECVGRNFVADLKTDNPDAYDRWIADARKIPNGEAVLWRIDGNGLEKPSWLFGTLHVTDRRVVNLPGPVLEAFFQARSVAVEMKSLGNRWADWFGNLFAAPFYLLPNEKTWDDYLTPSEITLMTSGLAKYGYVNIEGLKRYQPWSISLISLYPSCEYWNLSGGREILDEMIANWGRAAGKRVVGLETRYESSRIIAGTSLEAQFRTMVAYMKMSTKPEDDFETMIQIYLRRQTSLYVAYESGPYELTPVEIAAMREFDRHTLDLRNLVMRDRSLPLIRGGYAFIAVGASHLTGDQGLVELFRKAGYEVTPVN